MLTLYCTLALYEDSKSFTSEHCWPLQSQCDDSSSPLLTISLFHALHKLLCRSNSCCWCDFLVKYSMVQNTEAILIVLLLGIAASLHCQRWGSLGVSSSLHWGLLVLLLVFIAMPLAQHLYAVGSFYPWITLMNASVIQLLYWLLLLTTSSSSQDLTSPVTSYRSLCSLTFSEKKKNPV